MNEAPHCDPMEKLLSMSPKELKAWVFNSILERIVTQHLCEKHGGWFRVKPLCYCFVSGTKEFLVECRFDETESLSFRGLTKSAADICTHVFLDARKQPAAITYSPQYVLQLFGPIERVDAAAVEERTGTRRDPLSWVDEHMMAGLIEHKPQAPAQAGPAN